MKNITLAFVALIATTTLAHAGFDENHCWRQVTQQLERAGCQFGNDFAHNARRCLRQQQTLYKWCLKRAQATRRTFNAVPAHRAPNNRTTNLRIK